MKAELNIHFRVVKVYRLCLLGRWTEICDKTISVPGGWVPLREEHFYKAVQA